MNSLNLRRGHRDHGITLVTALILLVIITLLGISSVRMNSTEVKMPHNDQARVSALEIAPGATLNDPTATPVSDFGTGWAKASSICPTACTHKAPTREPHAPH